MSNDNAWAKVPTWDGQPGTFSAYRRRLATAFVRLKVGTLGELNTLGFPQPEAGSTAESLQQATGCAALLQSLGSLEDQVIAHYVAAQDDADYEFDYADHDVIWAAIKLYSQGSLTDLAGPDLDDKIAALAWPSQGTWSARASSMLQQLQELRDVATNLDDDDYRFSDAQACAKFRRLMCGPFVVEHGHYVPIKKLALLKTRALLDAKRFDNATAGGTAGVQSVLSALDPSPGDGGDSSTALDQLAVALAAHLDKRPRRSGRMELSTERRMDRSAGPPATGWKFCSHHGWNTSHKTDDCRALKAQRAPASGGEVYSKNADGTFSLVPTKALVATSTVAAQLAADYICLAGVAGPGHIFVDTAAEISTETSLATLTDVRELPADQAPCIDGTNDGAPIRATTVGTRTNRVGDFVYTEDAYFSPAFRYRITCARQLALAGVGIVVSPDPSAPAGARLYLEHDHTRVECTPLGNVFVLPAPTLALASPQQSGQSEPLPPPPAGAVEPYAAFRLRTGAATHDRALSLAKKLGVQLTDVNAADREQLNATDRIANQRAQRLVPLDTIDPNPGRLHISADTIGNKWPTSAAGNQSAQTFTILGAPGYYATVSPDHAAGTTWANLEGVLRNANPPFPILRDAVSQPVTIHSDQGSEFTGADFVQPAQRAGFQLSYGTAHKSSSGKQGLAENANGRAQQGMRRLQERAAPAFRHIKHDPALYWDHALLHAALLDRLNGAVNTGAITAADYSRQAPVEYGRLGTVTLPPSHPLRKHEQKQLAKRAALGLYLGNVGSKRKMLLESGKLMITTEVVWLKDAVLQSAATPNMQGVPAASDEPGADADTTSELAPATSSFTTATGTTIHTGDHVCVYWPAMQTDYSGSVTEIGPTEYTVLCDDGHELRHPIADADSGMTVTVLAATASPPHPSVAKYLTPDGDIVPGLLLGTITPPPAPPLPDYTPSSAPPAPRSIAAALASPDAATWLASILAEHHGHFSPPDRTATFKYVDTTSPVTPLRQVWVFRWKFENGKLSKAKSRMTCDGSRQHRGIDYHESYIGTAPIADVRRLEVLALLCAWSTYEDDWSQAYCQHPRTARPDGQPVRVLPVAGVRVRGPSGRFLQQELLMNLYGDTHAGYGHSRGVTDSLLNRNVPDGLPLCPVDLRQSPHQPTFFFAVYAASDPLHGNHMVLHLHNDNLRTWTSHDDCYQQLRAWLTRRWTVTGTGTPLQSQPPQDLLGTTVRYEADSVRFSMPSFVEAMLVEFNASNIRPADTPMIAGFSLSKLDAPTTESEKLEICSKASKLFSTNISGYQEATRFYAKVVSTIGWVVRQCAPVLAVAHSMLGRAMSGPSVKAFKAARRVLAYLSTRRNIGVEHHRERTHDWANGDWPEWCMSSDASFADDEHDRHSQGGYVGRFRGQAADTWSSYKAHRVCTSTFWAESLFASAAAKQAHYVWNKFGYLGLRKNQAIPLALDNAATILAAAAPIRKWSPKSKAFDIDAKYVCEAVEDGIIQVHHTPGNDFDCDAMTKPLPAATLAKYHSSLHGTRQ